MSIGPFDLFAANLASLLSCVVQGDRALRVLLCMIQEAKRRTGSIESLVEDVLPMFAKQQGQKPVTLFWQNAQYRSEVTCLTTPLLITKDWKSIFKAANQFRMRMLPKHILNTSLGILISSPQERTSISRLA